MKPLPSEATTFVANRLPRDDRMCDHGADEVLDSVRAAGFFDKFALAEAAARSASRYLCANDSTDTEISPAISTSTVASGGGRGSALGASGCRRRPPATRRRRRRRERLQVRSRRAASLRFSRSRSD